MRDDILLTLPKCCGKTMKASSESARFIEVWCQICNDVAYVKKNSTQVPQVLDD